jgi:hypothetical protein
VSPGYRAFVSSAFATRRVPVLLPADPLDNEKLNPRFVAPPAVVIRIELENPPKATVDAINEGEETRLADWIQTHPALQRLVAEASAAWEEMPGGDDEPPQRFKL